MVIFTLICMKPSSVEVQYFLVVFQERTTAWKGNYSHLYSMWQDCAEKQEA